jgi:ribosomal protein S18 acetylase RimI-like enzyme
MSFLDHWFNRAPAPGMCYIRDAKGQKYWLETVDDTNTTALYVAHRGKIIGRAIILWDKTYAELTEINIFRPKYQGRGIGRKLLKEVIELAQKRRASRIVGRIVDLSDMNTEYLYKWYERQGFQVNRRTGHLCMQLSDKVPE